MSARGGKGRLTVWYRPDIEPVTQQSGDVTAHVRIVVSPKNVGFSSSPLLIVSLLVRILKDARGKPAESLLEECRRHDASR